MKEIYFGVPLYRNITFDASETDKVDFFLNFFKFNGLIDGYNPELNENTSYQVEYLKKGREDSLWNFLGVNARNLRCVRTDYVIVAFFILENFENDEKNGSKYEFRKIGQYPTISDMEIGKYKKFSKVLPKEYLRELNKAIGLSVNGVGIGSFVYLRRIFEKLLDNYHLKAKEIEGWIDENYQRSRVSDRIDLLKDFLPNAVVEHRNVYSILSKGIHELEEQECLEYFPLVKDAILAMLEQDYLKRENEESQKLLSKNIKDLASKLK